MTDGDHRTQAEATWREVMRFDPPPVTDPFTEFTTDHVFGRVWSRPGLARRDRRLVSLTAVALAGQRDPLVIHLGAALDSGDLSLDELHEWVLHVAHYGGWPLASTAYAALREAQAGRG